VADHGARQDLGLRAPPAAVERQIVVEAIEAGPLWSQSDAEKKCPEVAKANGGSWNGEWRTTVPGKMSVCEVRRLR